MSKKAACGYLAAGIGIGAALSVFFAPKSGEETRKWVATKCFDAIDAAASRGQQEISKAVAAGRESFGKRKERESPVAVL